jgi:hypothetical protein
VRRLTLHAIGEKKKGGPWGRPSLSVLPYRYMS